MAKTKNSDLKKIVAQNQKRRGWKKFVQVMACIVVFCTTYALILPAITMEKDAKCGYTEHVHDESCYTKITSMQTAPSTCTYEKLGVHVHTADCKDAGGALICGYADYILHEHSSVCFDASGNLVCQLPEIKTHVHTDGCYAAVETEAPHSHDDSCYTMQHGELTCAQTEEEEPQHTDSCYEQIKTLTCTLEEGSVPEGTEAAEQKLVCTREEITLHAHDASCFNGALTCGKPEVKQHTHSEDCCDVNAVLTCGLTESEQHTHTDMCYGTWELTCELPEHTHTDECYGVYHCGLDKHAHTETCFDEEGNLVCEMTEHSHTAACCSDPTADVETAAVWKKSFANAELTGVWTDDVLAIAKSQIGYHESTANYEIAEDGIQKGYTRYGAWYGDAYGDWCAMFASFCLHYAEVEDMPLSGNCQNWITVLSSEEYNLYHAVPEDETEDAYQPKPSDLIFFDWEQDGKSDHVGFVVELIAATKDEPAKIKTIEGNSGDRVQYVTYELDSESIVGYAEIPEQPGVYTYIDDTVRVDVALPKDSEVPEDAVLSVKPIVDGDENYETLMEQAESAVEGTVNQVNLYDISFYTQDGAYIPVSDNAKVTMRFRQEDVAPNADLVVLHFEEEDTAPVVLDDVQVEEQAALAETETDAPEVPAAKAASDAQAEADPNAAMDTVVTFKTEGFSTFAVVQIGGDDLKIVTPVVQLNGQRVENVIITCIQGNGHTLTNNRITNNTQLAALDDLEIKYNANGTAARVLFSEDDLDDILWTFIPAGGNNQYYIKVQDENLYLNLNNNNNNLTLVNVNNVEDAQAIVVEATNDRGTVALHLPNSNKHLDHYGNGVFGTWTKNPQDNNKFILSTYDAGATFVTGLENQVYLIITNNPAVLTNQKVEGGFDDNGANRQGLQVQVANGTTVTQNNGNYTITDSAILAQSTWRFLSAGTEGQYYIQSVASGKYIEVTAAGVTLSDEPVSKIEAVDATGNAGDNVICLRVADATAPNGGYRYLNLCQGNTGKGVTSYAGGGTANDANNRFTLQIITDPLTAYIDSLPTREELTSLVNQIREGEHDDLNVAAQNVAVKTATGDQQFALPAIAVDADSDDADAKVYPAQVIAAAQAAKAAYDAWADKDAFPNYGEKLDELINWAPGTKDGTPHVVQSDIAPGVTVKIFDYNLDDTIDDFSFFHMPGADDAEDNKNQWTHIGGQGNQDTPHYMAVENQLGADGYPVLDQGNTSLAPLFNDPIAVMADGGGLFRHDPTSGYYYYSSNINAATYANGSFTLWDTVVRPPYTGWDNANEDNGNPGASEVSIEQRSNFLPFNQIAPDGSNLVYDGDYIQGKEVPTMSTTDDPANTRVYPHSAVINEQMNMWFGMTVEAEFIQPKNGQVPYTTADGTTVMTDMIFEFHGDDDVWVYIDGVLVLDIGGIHEAQDANINFHDGTVYSPHTGESTLRRQFYIAANGSANGYVAQEPGTLTAITVGNQTFYFNGETFADYTTHEFDFFYMERGGALSFCGINFNMPPAPDMVISKALSDDDNVPEYVSDSLSYTFRVLCACEQRHSFYLDGTQFEILENGNSANPKRYGNVAADGSFTLKPDESASFTGITLVADHDEFIVQELIGNEWATQYHSVTINGIATNAVEGQEGSSKVYQTGTLQPAVTNSVVYNNELTDVRSKLEIEKVVADGSKFEDDQSFEFVVKFGGQPIPVGAEYKLYENDEDEDPEVLQVAKEGIIPLQHGQIAVIENLVAGAQYEVSENLPTLTNGLTCAVSWSGTVETINTNGTTSTATASNNGSIPYNGVVHVTATNSTDILSVDVPFNKTLIGDNGTHTFNFDVYQVTQEGDSWVEGDHRADASVEVKDGKGAGTITITSARPDLLGTFYFKIVERNEGGDFIYDDTYYVVAVTVTKNDDGQSVAAITGAWKNGSEVLNVNDGKIINALEFTNIKTTSVIITKTVEGGTTDQRFAFTATAKDGNGNTVTLLDADSSFTLAHGESHTISGLPIGTVITVEETNAKGYITTYTLTENGVKGSSVNETKTEAITLLADGTQIDFTNTMGYELPKSGGTGTYLYTTGGLLLIAAAAILLYIQTKRRKEDTASS